MPTKAKTFRQLRIEANLTTEEAARKLCISRSMLYKVEQNYRSPSKKLMQRMSEAYNCSIQSIFSALAITICDNEYVI